MYKLKFERYTRISKAEAERLYNKNIDVLMVPIHVHPENNWGIGYSASIGYSGESFQAVVNKFMMYNCNYQLGYYPAYYKSNEA